MLSRHSPRWVQFTALFLIGISFQFLLHFFTPPPAIAQKPGGSAGGSCAQITAPLTSEELDYAKVAWQYFVKNTQGATGFTNSVNAYPSGSLWDMANYLMALNAVRWLNLIDQKEFDSRLNQFLTSLAGLKLFENALPNKVYQAATGSMVNYVNTEINDGIGWSALDLGRMLAAFHIIRTCHPQYTDWLKGIVSKWQVARTVKDGLLYGATVLPDKKTLLVQEGRLGYEEYAARGYELWGFKANRAIALQPFKFVDVEGVQIPVDTRDYKATNANNYVVSESYILDGIEFGLPGELGDYAARVLEAQKRRFEKTGQLTAVTEDNLKDAPYFLYNTVYANGVAWAPITDNNEPYPQFRTISTKAAFGWRYLYPKNAYAQQVFNAVKDLRSPDGAGFYAGLFEGTKQPNETLTGNTNGLILEILYYKARGNQPLIGSAGVMFATTSTPFDGSSKPPQSTAVQPANNTSTPLPPSSSSQASKPPALTPSKPDFGTQAAPQLVKVAPIPSVGSPKPSVCSKVQRPLDVVEKRYASAAWQYFESSLEAGTGLVNDRSDFNGVTLWGVGNYVTALHAARVLDLLSEEAFDQKTRQALGAIAQLRLSFGELPNRGYHSKTLAPVDYGNNPAPDGTGWSSLDVGRLLAALYTLKNCHPEYTEAVDQTILDWSFLRMIQNGHLASAVTTKSNTGQALARIYPETRLGYEEYAARAFQLWGFDVGTSAAGGQYETQTVEGVKVPTYRRRPEVGDRVFQVNQYTVSNPFLLYALEFGLDPQMKALAQPVLQAQAERYRRTGALTAAATSIIDQKPYIINNTIIGKGEPWAILTGDGQAMSEDVRLVSAAVAFAYQALMPDDAYANKLRAAVTDIYSPYRGFYEGFYEKTGKTINGFSSDSNNMILQALLYSATNQQPLIHPDQAMNSPWWQAIAGGDSGRGLPQAPKQTAQLVKASSASYWTSAGGSAAVTTIDAPATPKPPSSVSP